MAQAKILTCKAKAKSNPTKRAAKAKKTTKRPAAKRKTAKKKVVKRPAKPPVKKTVKKAAKRKIKKNPTQSRVQRAGAATKRVAKRVGAAAKEKGKDLAKRGAVATKKAAKRGAKKTAEVTSKAAKRVGRKTAGVAKEAWKGVVKGWKENPTTPNWIGVKSAIDRMMGNVHVGTSDEEVRKNMEKRCKSSGFDAKLTKKCVDYAIKAHRKNQRFYGDVMSGNFGPKRRAKKNPAVVKTGCSRLTAMKGTVKGAKDNPAVPRNLFKPIVQHGAKKNPTSKEKPFLAWTNAPKSYDYWYVKETGEVVKGFRLVKVTDRMRWEQFQVPRYQSGWHVAFEANDKAQLKNFGLPAKRNTHFGLVKNNPVRSGSYVYRIAYEIWDEEDAEAGETDKRGWEIEESDHFDTLDDLLQEVSHSGFWIEWSSSHPDSNSWIISESDQDYRTGAYTSKHLFIERTDKKPLTTQQLKHINKRLGLRGQFSGVKPNPSKDQLHLTQRRGRFFTIMDQERIPVPATRAQAALASGEAVKVPWDHAKLPHHARSEKLVSDKQLGAMLHNWHVGMGDPIYAAGSTLYAGHPTSLETLEDALSGIRGIKSSSKSRHNKKDHQELVAIEKNLEHRVSLMKAKGVAIPKNNPTSTGAKPPAYLKKDAKATRAILSTEKLEDGRTCFTFEWANPFALATGCGETAAKAAAMLYIHWPHSITPPVSESGKRLLWAKKNPTNAATGKVPVTSIQLHRMGTSKIEAVANVVREGNKGSLWAKANLEIQHWVNVSKTKTRAIPVNFVITYADGQTYSGQYVGVGTRQNLSGHIITVLNAVTGKKAPSGMSKSDYERTLKSIKPAEKKKWEKFLAKYDVGCTKCAKSNPTRAAKENPASSGYGYVYRGRNWQASKDDKWDTEVVDGGGVFVGTRTIDGSKVKVYKTGVNEYVAQTHGVENNPSGTGETSKTLTMTISVTWRKDPPSQKRPMLLWKIPQQSKGAKHHQTKIERRGTVEQAIVFFEGSGLSSVLRGAISKVGEQGHVLRVSVSAEGSNGKTYTLAQWNAWSKEWETAMEPSTRNWIPNDLIRAVERSVSKGSYI